MAATPGVPEQLVEYFLGDEGLRDAIAVMRVGTLTTVPNGQTDDIAHEVGLGEADTGWLVLTDRRLLLADAAGMPLHHAATSSLTIRWVDVGRAQQRVRRLRVGWPDRRWSLLEMPIGLWHASRAEAFTTTLQGACHAHD